MRPRTVAGRVEMAMKMREGFWIDGRFFKFSKDQVLQYLNGKDEVLIQAQPKPKVKPEIEAMNITSDLVTKTVQEIIEKKAEIIEHFLKTFVVVLLPDDPKKQLQMARSIIKDYQLEVRENWSNNSEGREVTYRYRMIPK